MSPPGAARRIAAELARPRLARWFRAPGRVNLIGEHTDYNDGFVLPMAIDRECIVAAEQSATVRVLSLDAGETVELPADGSADVGSVTPAWGRYVAAVVHELAALGRPPVGMDAVLASDVPVGSGSPPMNLARGTIEGRDGGQIVRMGSSASPIPAEVVHERKLDTWAGREVNVGIRPEDIEGTSENGRDGDAVTIEATIDRVEALGADILGFFTIDAPPAKSESIAEATGGGLEEVSLITREGTPLCATFEPRSGLRRGDRVAVTIDVRRLHFFDPESENAMAPRRAGRSAASGGLGRPFRASSRRRDRADPGSVRRCKRAGAG